MELDIKNFRSMTNGTIGMIRREDAKVQKTNCLNQFETKRINDPGDVNGNEKQNNGKKPKSTPQ